ncbi:ABC transporter substrate-binding protein [Kutzneria sp. NPDC052558]|uniref:ABC transporter substrate-binding protein n=1 Tax=Kutzneria sp. NPDC052558 TaxID=3364121 RepID=UPI0037CA0C23
MTQMLSRRGVLQGAAALFGLAAVGSAAPAQAAGTTLKVLVNTPHLPAFTTVLAPAWAQLTGGTLEATATDYTQLTDAMIDDVRGDGEYDLFDYFYYGLGELVQAGALVDLTDWIGGQPDLDTHDFLPSIYDAYTLYNGRRYGLPYDGDQHLVFYNTKILDAYGLRPPTTWDEYDAAARTIAAGGVYYGAIVQGQPDPLVLGPAFVNRLVGYGGTLVDGAGRPTLTSDAAIAAAQHLVDIAPYAMPTPTQVGFDTGTAAFLSGQGALIETWTGMAQRAADPTLSKIVGNWGAAALPLGGGNRVRRTPLNSGYGLGVSTASKNKAAALSFVKWATSSAEMLVETTSPDSAIDPNRSSVLHSAAYAAATPAAVDLIRAGLDGTPLVWPKGPDTTSNLQALVDQLALAIEGQQDVRTALRNAQAAWRP